MPQEGVFLDQVKILVKKDLWILKRRKKALCFELLIPIVMLACTYYFAGDYITTSTYPPHASGSTCSNDNQFDSALYVSPPAVPIRKGPCALGKHATVIPFGTKAEAIHYFQNDNRLLRYASPTIGVFGSLPNWNFQYTAQDPIEAYIGYQPRPQALLTLAQNLFNYFNANLSWPFLQPANISGLQGYNVTRQLELYRFPTTTFSSANANHQQLGAMLAAIVVAISFWPMLLSIGTRLVEEKQSKMREHMRIMGVKPLSYVVAIFASGLMRVVPYTVLMVIGLAIWSDLFAVAIAEGALLTILYALTIVAFAFFMPVFFSRSPFVTGMSSLFLLLGISGGVFVTALPVPAQYAIMFFFSPVTFVFAVTKVFALHTVTTEIPLSMAVSFLLVQIVMYTAFAQYLYALFPGQYGLPQHPLFPLYMLKRFVFGVSKDGGQLSAMPAALLATVPSNRNQRIAADIDIDAEMDSMEGESRECIVLRGLLKRYNRGEPPAVDGLTLDMKYGEVFALLGHNGAGKTTAISLLTGLLKADSYNTATVLDMDLNRDIDLIRLETGVCPQFDILFEELTALQHMELFARIKGASNLLADAVLSALDLPWTNKTVTEYSGGMKRRLSVACALAGGASIIFLDEPSSGLDPLSRRRMWDLIRDLRDEGKTVVLTTHFMEEAEYLGDRIAIMSQGKLHCCSTSNELKHEYGVGYYLTLSKSIPPTSESRAAEGDEMRAAPRKTLDSAEVLELIKQFCPNATVHNESLGDVQYLLPVDNRKQFPGLFAMIEERYESLGATSYGLRMNSLEDVFVTIAHEAELEQKAEAEGRSYGLVAAATKTNQSPLTPAVSNTNTLPSGQSVEEMMAASADKSPYSCSVFLSHIATVFRKKALYFRHAKRMWFLGIFVPLVFIAIGFACTFKLHSIRIEADNQPIAYSGLNRQFQTAVVPDLHQWKAPVLGPLSSNQKALLAKAAELYPKYVGQFFNESHSSSDSQYVIQFQEYSWIEFEEGLYVDTHSLSPIGLVGTRIPVKLTFLDGSYKQYEKAFSDGYRYWNWWRSLDELPHGSRYGGLDVSFSPNPYHHDPGAVVFMYLLMQMSRIELQMETGDRPPVWPNVTVKHFPPQNITSIIAQEVRWRRTSTPQERGSSPQYDVAILGCLLAIAAIVYAANASLEVADELNREIFQMMRMHGLSALAYWTGSVLFDATLGLWMSGCLLAGVYICDIEPLKDPLFLFCVSFQIIGLVIHVLLVAFALVALLPKLKQATYLLALLGVSLLELFPALLIIFLGKYPLESLAGQLLLQLPPLAIGVTFVPDDRFTPNEYFRRSEGIISFFAVWYWSIIPIIILYRFSTKTRRKHKSNAGNAERVAAAINYRRGRVEGRAFSRVAATEQDIFGTDDPDILAEEKRIVEEYEKISVAQTRGEAAPQLDDMVAALNLRQDFEGKSLAVRQLSFGVRRGECFGLLGPNGAGKTTTVKMLQQDLTATSGMCCFPYVPDASLGNLSLDTLYRRIRIGVCQQSDTLWETFTDREHLELYLRCRLGPLYHADEWKEYMTAAIGKVYLTAEKKKASQYSGGMKRKLAVCLAMYTGALSMFLDEPSTGMDPYSRRAMWKAINESLHEERCVLLTTHSMEEADAVCSRIVIVGRGEMKCIGNGQRLKNRFGRGYVITLILKDTLSEVDLEEKIPQLDAKLKEVFGPTCERSEVVAHTVRYTIKQISLAKAFKELEQSHTAWDVDSYSVHQMTNLDEIFLQFAGGVAE